MKRSQSFDSIASRCKARHTTLCFLFVRPGPEYARFVDSFEYACGCVLYCQDQGRAHQIRIRRKESIVDGVSEFYNYWGMKPELPEEHQRFPVLFKRNSLPLSQYGDFKIPINVRDDDGDTICGSFVKKWMIPRSYFILIEDEKLCEVFLNALGSTDRNLYEEFRAFLVKPYEYDYSWEDLFDDDSDDLQDLKKEKITFPLDASDIL